MIEKPGDKPVVTLQETSAFSRHISRLGAVTLRKVFAKFAENTALTTLTEICAFSGIVYPEDELRLIIRDTIVPAYSNGWLDDVVTLSQLQKWVERRTALILADSLIDIIGLNQYLLLHCLSSALDAGKLTEQDILNKCPAAGYMHKTLISDAALNQWKSGASIVRTALEELDPKNGLTQWLSWVNSGMLATETALPLDWQQNDQ